MTDFATIVAGMTAGDTNYVAPGVYTLTRAVTIPRGTKVIGKGKPWYNYSIPGWTGGVQINYSGGGTLLVPSGVVVNGLCFNDMAQPANGVPVSTPAPITIGDGLGSYDVEISDNVFWKSWLGVNANGSTATPIANLKLNGNRGCPVTFASIEGIADWQIGAFDDNSFNSGRAAPTSYLTNAWTTWVMNNAQLLQIGGNDWLQISKLQAFGYGFGALIQAGYAYPSTGPYTFDNCQFDATQVCIQAQNTFNYRLAVQNCRFTPFTPINGGANIAGIGLQIHNATVSSLLYEGNFHFGPPYAMLATTPSGYVFDASIIGNRAQDGAGTPSISIGSAGASATLRLENNITHGFAPPNFGGTLNVYNGPSNVWA